MGLLGRSETSVRNYHYLLYKKSRRGQFSATSWWKPDITHVCQCSQEFYWCQSITNIETLLYTAVTSYVICCTQNTYI